jgi:hypothetical protein
MTTFGDRLFEMGGVPVGMITQGDVWHVKPASGSDSNDGVSPDTALKTLGEAQDRATANQNDIVLLYAESNSASGTTDYQSATLDWAKDFVHLIGVGAAPFIGHRSRVAFLSTYATASNLFTLSGDGCYVANIEFFAGVVDTNPTGCMLVTGQRTHVHNCQISGIGDTHNDIAGAYSLKVGYPAGENLFTHCYIGLDTVIRATATQEVQITGTGAGTRVPRVTFENCMINSYTSGSTFKALATSYGDRFVLLDNCKIAASLAAASGGPTGAVAPTGAISNSNMNGAVMLHNTSVFGYANVTTTDDAQTLVMAPLPGVDAGLGTGVDVA